jgi:VanZ family protein
MNNRKDFQKKKTLFELIIIYTFSIYLFCLLLISWVPGKILPENLSTDLTTLFHFSEFFILSVLSLLLSIYILKEKKAMIFFMIGFGISFLTEFGQYFIPGRACVLSDFFANLAGFFIVPVLIIVMIEFAIESIIKFGENFSK